MYDINKEGYYYKRFFGTVPDDDDIFTNQNDHAICSGVMIINLDELRKDDMMNKIHKFMKEKKEILSKKNIIYYKYCFYHKIRILPHEFGIFNTINSFHRINDLLLKFIDMKKNILKKN